MAVDINSYAVSRKKLKTDAWLWENREEIAGACRKPVGLCIYKSSSAIPYHILELPTVLLWLWAAAAEQEFNDRQLWIIKKKAENRNKTVKNLGKCVRISYNISDSLYLQIQDSERNTVMWRESTNTVASENSPFFFLLSALWTKSSVHCRVIVPSLLQQRAAKSSHKSLCS